MEAYKVLERKGNTLISAGSIPFGLKLDYKPNEWTYPLIPGSKIFCFLDLERAESFMGSQLRIHRDFGNKRIKKVLEIWKIEATNPFRFYSLPCMWDRKYKYLGRRLPREALDFWTKPNNDDIFTGSVYDEVYGAEKIKLISLVK